MNVLIIALIAAQSNPCRSPDTLADADVDARLVEASAAVTDHENNLGWWFGGTFGVHAAVMIGAIVISNLTDDTGVRDEMWVAAVGSALGLLTLATGQPPVYGGGAAVFAVQDKRQRLSKLEALLEKNAKKINFSQSWISHGASFLYSLGASIVLWFALDRKRAAITQFIGGQLIGQGRIILQPVGSRDSWDTYRSRYLAGCGEPVEAEAAVRIEPAGAGFALRF